MPVGRAGANQTSGRAPHPERKPAGGARGIFVTFEGPEGSGKSSQARWLVRRLRRAGWPAVFLRDPGSTALGHSLRRILLRTSGPIPSLVEALLFIGGRVALVEERIRPALARGRIVLCDRFHDSTVVYQGFGGGLDVRWVDRVGRRAIGGVMPSLTILLDVPTSLGFSRLSRARDRMEHKTRAFHRRVQEGFLRWAKANPRRIVVVDASQPSKTVRRAIEQIVWLHLYHCRVSK